MSQRAFNNKGNIEDTLGLERRDYITLEKWKRENVLCPWCLYYGQLYNFRVEHKRKYKTLGKISYTRAKCPECGIGIMIKTLRRLASLSMEDYAYWFWENIFIWGAYERVSWEKLKKKLYHFSYDDRQSFWDVYKEFKNSNNKQQVAENRREFNEYKAGHVTRQHEI